MANISDEFKKEGEDGKFYMESLLKAQDKQIKELNRKINELIEENKTLKKQNKEPVKSDIGIISLSSISDEEIICTQELAKLREISNERELTLEESKKLDTFFKILNSIRTGDKTEDKPSNKKIDDATLLKLVSEMK